MRGRVWRRGSRWVAIIELGRDEARNRKRIWKGGFATKREARDWLTEQEGRLAQGTYVEPSRLTVGEYLLQWLEGAKARVRLSTWDSYRRNLEHHVIPGLGSIRLQQLTTAQLNAFYAGLLGSGSV